MLYVLRIRLINGHMLARGSWSVFSFNHHSLRSTRLSLCTSRFN